MKLIFCTECQDIVRLIQKEKRTCQCGESSGQYMDDLNAWYAGKCIPLGIANNTLKSALDNQPRDGMGNKFKAFVIPKICETFINMHDIKETLDTGTSYWDLYKEGEKGLEK